MYVLEWEPGDRFPFSLAALVWHVGKVRERFDGEFVLPFRVCLTGMNAMALLDTPGFHEDVEAVVKTVKEHGCPVHAVIPANINPRWTDRVDWLVVQDDFNAPNIGVKCHELRFVFDGQRELNVPQFQYGIPEKTRIVVEILQKVDPQEMWRFITRLPGQWLVHTPLARSYVFDMLEDVRE
jgi:hypothetical protein